jgi:hypothetical protein
VVFGALLTITAAVHVGPASAGIGDTARLVPSDSHVLPGEVVTMEVEGAPDGQSLAGGVDSYLEARRNGRWKRIYMLHWFGYGQPSVRAIHTGVEEVLVRASPFPIVVPAVRPGRYRVTRRFLVNPGQDNRELTLATSFTINRCPRGQAPAFVADVARSDPQGLGIPTCA